MDAADDLTAVLSQFGLQRSACAVTALGNAGGFSGAKLWRVNSGSSLCLRRWPANYPDETRLRFIHAVMEFAGMQLDFVPRLQRSTAGETAIRHGDHLWELTTWLPGEADFHRNPTAAKLEAAMRAIAQIHLALEHFPTRMTGSGTSPGIAARHVRLGTLRSSLPQLRMALANTTTELRSRGTPLINFFEQHAATVEKHLLHGANIAVPLQPCLRDIWHDHVLYVGDHVTGVVDFDAVRIETIAGDLARLLGSLIGDDAAQRKHGLRAYEALRPLSDDERQLIDVFDASMLLMSGMNWLVWLLIDGRQFADMGRVHTRLDDLLARVLARQRTMLWQAT